MSNAVSALNHASFTGIAQVEEMGLQGMITVRGDLSAAAMKKAVKAAAGVDIPGTWTASVTDGKGVCWMSPDELLVLCPYAEADATVAALTKALAKEHAMGVDVSDARALFRVSGPNAREVMAKLCPIDLSPGAFGPGQFRRTRLAQVPAAFWMDGDESFQIICFRSVAQYVFDLLSVAAQPGSEVGVF